MPKDFMSRFDAPMPLALGAKVQPDSRERWPIISDNETRDYFEIGDAVLRRDDTKVRGVVTKAESDDESDCSFAVDGEMADVRDWLHDENPVVAWAGSIGITDGDMAHPSAPRTPKTLTVEGLAKRFELIGKPNYILPLDVQTEMLRRAGLNRDSIYEARRTDKSYCENSPLLAVTQDGVDLACGLRWRLTNTDDIIVTDAFGDEYLLWPMDFVWLGGRFIRNDNPPF